MAHRATSFQRNTNGDCYAARHGFASSAIRSGAASPLWDRRGAFDGPCQTTRKTLCKRGYLCARFPAGSTERKYRDLSGGPSSSSPNTTGSFVLRVGESCQQSREHSVVPTRHSCPFIVSKRTPRQANTWASFTSDSPSHSCFEKKGQQIETQRQTSKPIHVISHIR